MFEHEDRVHSCSIRFTPVSRIRVDHKCFLFDSKDPDANKFAVYLNKKTS